MMRKYFSLILFSILFYQAKTQSDTADYIIDTSSYMFAGIMYEKADYETATRIYEDLLNKNGESAEVYYNLGNCYFKLNQFGKSILNYERALLFDPIDDDVRHNLELANLRIQDKVSAVNETLMLIWWRNFINLLSVNTWWIIAILFLWLALSGFILYRFTVKLELQRLGFLVFTSCLFIFLLTAIAAFSKSSHDDNFRFAIVMVPSSIVKSEPNESSTNKFLIHEGLKMRVVDEGNEWSEIKMLDGHIGWIKNSDIENINIRK